MNMSLLSKLSCNLIMIATIVSCNSDDNKNSDKKLYFPLVEIAEAEIKPFSHVITAQGNIESNQDVLLSAEIGGLITKIKVQPGDKVTAGQTLIILDQDIINSNIKEIKTQLEYSQYMLVKQGELRAKGVGSEFDYETARNGVNSQRARLNSLNVQRSKLSIKAPFSGIIDVVFAKQGQLASPQTPLLRLVNISNVDITASISEKHISSIKIGTPIEVTFPNFNDSILNLNVNNVGSYIEPVNRTFRIVANKADNKDLLPNMLAEVKITDFSVEKGLVIPNKSILKSQDNTDYVWVVIPSSEGVFKVKKVVVELIKNQDGFALIKNNAIIKNGTRVIVDGGRGITEKDQVRIKQ